MKKRLAKVLALGLTAAMVAGAPLSAMASEVNAADQAGNTAVAEENTDAAESAVEEAEETPEAEADAEQGIATQDLIDSNYVPVENGVDPMSLDGLVPLNDGNWYYFEHGAFQSYRGLYPNSAGWWYLDRGKIDFSYNGVYNYGNSQWYVQGGQIQFGYTGPAEVTMWDGQEVEESIYPRLFTAQP